MERCLDFAPFGPILCATFVCGAELVLQCCDCAVGCSPAPMRAGRRRAYYDQVPIARSTSRPDGLWNTRRSNSGTTASRWSKMSAWIAS